MMMHDADDKRKKELPPAAVVQASGSSKFSNLCVELELELFPENKSEGPHRLILQVPGGWST
jgi:hypothetical protein